MEQAKQTRETTHRVPVGRIATAAFLVGGLSTSVLAVGGAGALTSREAKSGVVVSTTKNAKFGTILVSGKTLYTLQAGKTCTGQCLKIWPQLLLPKGATKATAGSGVSASKLGTVTRSGGLRQVTYAGKALYWFSGDTASGQANGNVTDTWGKWTAVATAKPAAASSNSNTTTSSGSGTGGAAF